MENLRVEAHAELDKQRAIHQQSIINSLHKDYGIEADMSLTSAWPQHMTFAGHYNHHWHHGYGYADHPHKYGYVPNGAWGAHNPYPLSAKDKERWEAWHKQYASDAPK